MGQHFYKATSSSYSHMNWFCWNGLQLCIWRSHRGLDVVFHLYLGIIRVEGRHKPWITSNLNHPHAFPYIKPISHSHLFATICRICTHIVQLSKRNVSYIYIYIYTYTIVLAFSIHINYFPTRSLITGLRSHKVHINWSWNNQPTIALFVCKIATKSIVHVNSAYKDLQHYTTQSVHPLFPSSILSVILREFK